MANVNIKEVEGGQDTTPALTDAVELDNGTLSFWSSLQNILDLFSQTAETITGIKIFGSAGNVGKLKIAGATSGTTILDATAVASGTLTLPAATDTLVGKATTDTLTNKILTAPTISDFTNAAHDHGDADDGGVLVAAAITGLHGYHLVASTDALSPADATTYYFGTPLALNFTTGATTARIDIPKAGTITRVWMHWRPGTVGSNEQSTVSLRLNDTSDTTITSTLDLSASAYITTVVSIAVAVGDYVTFKWLTPTWVTTNPANVEVYGGIWIDRT